MQKKIILALSALLIALIGCIIYMSFTPNMSSQEMKKQTKDLKSEYDFIKKDLELNLNIVNSSNTLITVQKKRIEDLLGKKNLSEEELTEAKGLIKDISRNVMTEYQKQLKDTKEEITKVNSENLKSVSQLNSLSQKISNLEKQKRDINIKYVFEKKESDRKTTLLDYASNLSLSNFTFTGIKVRNNGKEVETDKASRINKVKLSFDINDNLIAESGKKELYFVVRKPDGSLANFDNRPTGIIKTDGRKIQYSDKIDIDFVKGETKNIEFMWDNAEFKKGNYNIEIYENNSKRISKISGLIKKLD